MKARFLILALVTLVGARYPAFGGCLGQTTAAASTDPWPRQMHITGGR